MAEVRELATGLLFPEGPIWMSDGSIVLVEIARGTLSRVTPDGKVEVVADCGDGPNGAAIGPDGKVYVCNNGGCFHWEDRFGMRVPGPLPETWKQGKIQRVDLDTGELETLYTECDGRPLRAPNDIVFDSDGGFWFTDHGVRTERASDRTGIFYAKPDGSLIREEIFPLDAPNGVGLSPDQKTLYAAETHSGRVWSWSLKGPGQVDKDANPLGAGGASLLHGLPGLQLLDSLAVDGEGWVCVGTLVNGGITAISPDGQQVEHHPMPDLLVTNICFGGDDYRTAFCTLSGTGKLVAMEWPRPGLKLAYER